MTFMRAEGKHLDLSNELYHSDVHYFSSSQLKEALVSPAHFKHYIVDRHGKSKTTKAMELGTLIHTVVLEPHKFDAEYVIAVDAEVNKDGSLTAKELKKWQAKYPGLTPISEPWYKIATRARARFEQHPEYAKFIYHPDCEYEPSYFVNCKETGLRLRVRPDCINLEHGYIVDLKSTYDVSKHSFTSDAIYKYHYDLSAYMYQMVIYQLTGVVCDFYWACAGKEDLVPVAMYKLSKDTFEKGKTKFFKAADNIKTALTVDELVYQNEIEEI